MSTPRSDRVVELFAEAVDRSPEERARFLDEACAEDAALRAEVEELLRFDPGETVAEPRAAEHTSAPRTIGRFRVERVVAEGGMGVVYAAVDPTLGRTVALKQVKGHRDAAARARLLREAQAMARIAHPNVAAVHEVGVDQDEVFIAMEYVEGVTLARWLRDTPRPWRAILERFVQAGRGLAAAHEARLLHRDFKPENVLVGVDGRVRVVDFGLARAAAMPAPGMEEHGSALDLAVTHAGAVMGTPGYMSPEHFGLGEVGPASDQWSFAASLYRALYGRPPFEGQSLGELRESVASTTPRPAPASDVSAEIEAAIARGLARDPAERFESMNALLAVLERALERHPDRDASVFLRQRRRALAIAGALSLVSFLSAGLRTDWTFDIGMDGALLQGGGGLMALAAAAFVFRDSVFRAPHHRRLLLFLAVPLAAMCVHRAYGLARGFDVQDVLRVDALIALSASVLGGIALERWIFIAAALMALYLLVSLLAPVTTVPGFGLSLLGIVALAIRAWPVPTSAPTGARRASLAPPVPERRDSAP